MSKLGCFSQICLSIPNGVIAGVPHWQNLPSTNVLVTGMCFSGGSQSGLRVPIPP